MPTVLRVGPYRFYFYSEEGKEPPHVHVEAGEKKAKYWITPVELQKNEGFRSGERREIEQILHQNLTSILSKWNEYFKINTD
ncbi:DUF4160 domain-containing protein [Granulicella tundricola]|uniref:DUF4160 domain-containing protein n=1 Tax=Granulicella tundricola (strain ATCC BAA-1859 / DSM 23138 / MP5ACTX9) TaxID=1198114 RepID=E8WZT9_GRATM|nr:DUF4160 domain-containing protein [Granulicella tundricola]ADW67750.1 hypothetical protein AciX9_0680 [Granulicella tundricola MP5ACTX9]